PAWGRPVARQAARDRQTWTWKLPNRLAFGAGSTGRSRIVMSRRRLCRFGFGVHAPRVQSRAGVRMRGLAHDDRGNGVFEDQLFLVIGFQYDRIFIEGSDTTREFYPAQQINGNERFVFTSGVEERILDILRRLVVHRRSPLFVGDKSRSHAAPATGTRQYDTVLASSFQPPSPIFPLLYNPARLRS